MNTDYYSGSGWSLTVQQEAAYNIEGITSCCDCLDPIPAERLAAKPDAARCIECQLQYEKEQKQKLNLKII